MIGPTGGPAFPSASRPGPVAILPRARPTPVRDRLTLEDPLMFRLRLKTAAALAGLGLLCGCTNTHPCNSCGEPQQGVFSRWFSGFGNRRPADCPCIETGNVTVGDGPIVPDPGCCGAPGCGTPTYRASPSTTPHGLPRLDAPGLPTSAPFAPRRPAGLPDHDAGRPADAAADGPSAARLQPPGAAGAGEPVVGQSRKRPSDPRRLLPGLTPFPRGVSKGADPNPCGRRGLLAFTPAALLRPTLPSLPPFRQFRSDRQPSLKSLRSMSDTP